MANKKWEIRNKKLLLISCFLLLTFIVACGRRGDPVAITPYKIGTDSKKVEPVVTKPDAPAGLAAIYTRQSIVLTWDEIHGQEIKFYRIYRSEGKDFAVIAETVTSVFNDKNIEPSKKYYYKVSAVGNQESLLSEEIGIITKNR